MKLQISFVLTFVVINSFSQIIETFHPTMDASIGFHDGYPSDITNYGNALHFSGFSQPSEAGYGDNTGWGIMYFDLSSILPELTILSATLNLYAFGNDFSMPIPEGHTGENSCYISRITSEWEEYEVTWGTKPTLTNLNQITLPESDLPDQDYLEIDVTELVQDMIDLPLESFGFCIRLVESEPTAGLLFHSSDYFDIDKIQTLKIIYDFTHGTHVENQSSFNTSLIYFDNSINSIMIKSNSFGLDNFIFQLSNISGQIIFSKTLNTNQSESVILVNLLNMSLPSGIYLATMINNEVSYSNKIFIGN